MWSEKEEEIEDVNMRLSEKSHTLHLAQKKIKDLEEQSEQFALIAKQYENMKSLNQRLVHENKHDKAIHNRDMSIMKRDLAH
eukprot:10739280-Karenia_brevis.AAC.1